MKRIFVGIPVLNRFDLLDKAIEALDYANCELFIINNNSVNLADIEAFGKLQGKYQFDSFSPRYNLGVAASWNRIITTAWSRGYDFVYIGSNDTFLGQGALRTLVEMEKPEPECLWAILGFNFWCLRMSAVPKIGLPDENFMPAYFEDNDYVYRIRRANLEYVHVADRPYERNGRIIPAATAVHLGSQTIASDPEYAIHNGNTFHNWNRNHYLMKWGGLPEQERFEHPYNDPNRAINWWPDPAGSIAVRDWDNGKRARLEEELAKQKKEQEEQDEDKYLDFEIGMGGLYG